MQIAGKKKRIRSIRRFLKGGSLNLAMDNNGPQLFVNEVDFHTNSPKWF